MPFSNFETALENRVVFRDFAESCIPGVNKFGSCIRCLARAISHMLEGEPLFYQRLAVTLPEFGRCYMYILSDSYQASLDVSELVPVQSGCWVENS